MILCVFSGRWQGHWSIAWRSREEQRAEDDGKRGTRQHTLLTIPLLFPELPDPIMILPRLRRPNVCKLVSHTPSLSLYSLSVHSRTSKTQLYIKQYLELGKFRQDFGDEKFVEIVPDIGSEAAEGWKVTVEG